MKNISLALMVLTSLSINISSAQAVNQPSGITANNASYSEQTKITNSTNMKCYWIGIPVCK